MSKTATICRITTPAIRSRKNGTPLVCLTAYSTPMARLMDDTVDLILVGDSLGMVLYGMESTLGVTLDMMIAHGRAVMRGSTRACVIVDMPFGTTQESPEAAFRNCARVMQETGCSGIKLEGGREMAETVHFLTQRGIPVMGHTGLRPQMVNTLGGYRSRGHGAHEANAILDDSVAIAEAGAFSIVLEGMVEDLAKDITARIDIPTIGIGASSVCDGQILVSEDMTGLFGQNVPKFVQVFGDVAGEAQRAIDAYADAVRRREFPAAKNVYKAKLAAPKSRLARIAG
ncbi:MAG: 3-methyl-2-oxobutanoate hydroxymethyltransferase [Alphaproteobacteria bacterium]|nr:3-methyl-2-oxobutanoate hydroxymethyltransferase [Alphaproteobacteria bacterium]